ncbi:MAG: 1,4-alpha-glucan branching enzyme [Verrucomicrobiota bacterium]
MTRRAGSLALILHAHLPFVRHPEHKSFLEEQWFFEAITESYVPLLRLLLDLVGEGLPVKLAISVTPTLAAMLQDDLLGQRYLEHLERQISLAKSECRRNRRDAALLPLSKFYRDFFSETRRLFVDQWNCDLLAVLRQLRDSGAVEIMASAATHGLLPILQETSCSAAAQISIGCDYSREIFGADPAGFWLPECAYAPGIEQLLQKQNIRWFILDAHALEHARPPSRRGTFAPCYTPAGPAAFARDVRASRQVWSAEGGYPGHSAYRDFYRDIGFDLPASELRSFGQAGQNFTGIKYHRVTAPHQSKKLYDRTAAEEIAREHASHFVEQRIADIEGLSAGDWNPVVTVPFDAELFGHWWFEGPIFLEHVLRTIAGSDDRIALTTPGEFLAQNPTQQVVQPSASSWGDKGFFDVWLDKKCSWIYPHLQAAAQRMTALAKKYETTASPEIERMLQQLGRELLLSQASDWPFLIRNETAKEYAERRVTDHLRRFDGLATALEQGKTPDLKFLGECEKADNLFPNLNWRCFA